MQKSVTTIGELRESFTNPAKTEQFLKDAKSELSVVQKSREQNEKAKTSNIVLGLYMAVMQDYFEFTLAPKKSPEFIAHKGDAMSYVRFMLGVQKGETFPSTAWNNAYVVFMLVLPDGNGKQALAEADYLALGQGDIDALRRLTKHLVETDPAVDIRAHADVLEAVALCQGRKDGYRKALREIENRVTGKGAEKKNETPNNIIPLTAEVAASALLEAVKHAGDKPVDESTSKLVRSVFHLMDALMLLSGLSDETLDALKESYENTLPADIAAKQIELAAGEKAAGLPIGDKALAHAQQQLAAAA